jgi:hypothetical protein
MSENMERYNTERQRLDDQFFHDLEDNKVRFDLEVKALVDSYFRARRELDLHHGLNPYGGHP